MKKKKIKVRNGVVLAMLGRKGSVFKDRRAKRGGSKNKMNEILRDE